MRIVIETIPHESQRYNTCGDWFFEADGELKIFVSETGDKRMNLLVAVHELTEAVLCEDRGIAEEDVLAFDLAHADLDDPGHDPNAPYNLEHTIAEIIERILATEMSINWFEYEKVLDAL